MTENLHRLLGEQKERNRRKWTVEKIAASIYCGRSHITTVLSNHPGRGGQTRRKLVIFFKKEFPKNWEEILKELNWDEEGKLIQNEPSQVGRST